MTNEQHHENDMGNDAALLQTARRVRKMILSSIFDAQTGHAGPSLSMVEILVTLYFSIMNHRPHEPHWDGRDRLVLSKGHGAPGLYAVLCEAGYLQVSELTELRALYSRLQGHPNAAALPGIDFSTGSLGQGLSVATGIALGFKLRKKTNRVFCIVGDGELQEGQNWEAAMSASAFDLSNLAVIVDRNRLQGDGDTEAVMPIEPLASKFDSFGWRSISIDGHDFGQLHSSLATTDNKPIAIIANTVKGKGVSFMENVLEWHHKPVSKPLFEQANREIDFDDNKN